jgi:hypothetical protein
MDGKQIMRAEMQMSTPPPGVEPTVEQLESDLAAFKAFERQNDAGPGIRTRKAD